MGDENKPVTGRGSPAGPRWFVSKNPGLVLEIVPERYPDVSGNKAPFVRAAFKSETKSEMHAGDGYLGSRNKLQTDTNANRHYGVYFVMDPGPVPPGGYKDDVEDVVDEKGIVHEDWSRSAAEKLVDRMIIDHIRKIYSYRHSPQDNQYRVTGRLIELNWDPSEMRVYVDSMVIPGMGKPMARPPLLGAPIEKTEDREPSEVPPMGSVKLRRRVVPS